MESGQTSDYPIDMGFRDMPVTDPVAESNRRTLLDALNRLMSGDPDGFWAIYDPEAVFYEASCLPYGGAHRGIEAVKAGFAQIEQTFSRMDASFEALLAAEDLVILYQTNQYTVRANGNSGELKCAEVFRFRDGKVIEWRAHYFDACAIAKAITGEGN